MFRFILQKLYEPNVKNQVKTKLIKNGKSAIKHHGI